MEQVKVYKSFDGKFYNSKDECEISDKKYLIKTIFIDRIDKDKLYDYVRKGSDDFWSFLNENISNIIYNGIDLYIDKTNVKVNNSNPNTEIKSMKTNKRLTDEQ